MGGWRHRVRRGAALSLRALAAASLAASVLVAVSGVDAQPAEAQSSAKTPILHRTEIVEGQERYFEISNIPDHSAYFLRLLTGTSGWTLDSPRGLATVNSGYSATRRTRTTGITTNANWTGVGVRLDRSGRIQFEATVHADSDGDSETFGVQLCSAACNTSASAIIGEWTVTTLEPGADTTLTGTGGSITVSNGTTTMMENANPSNGDSRDNRDTIEISLDSAAPSGGLIIVGKVDTQTTWRRFKIDEESQRAIARLNQSRYTGAASMDGDYVAVRVPGGHHLQDHPVTITSLDNIVDTPGGTLSGTLSFRVLEIGNEGGSSGITLPDVPLTVTHDDEKTSVTIQADDTADDVATEGDSSDTARFKVKLGRALAAGENLTVPLTFSGATQGTQFTIATQGSPTNIAYATANSGAEGRLTFTGPAAAEAVLLVTAAGSDGTAESLVISTAQHSDARSQPAMDTTLAGGACSGTGCSPQTPDSYRITLREPQTGPRLLFHRAPKEVYVEPDSGVSSLAFSLSEAPSAGDVSVTVTSSSPGLSVTRSPVRFNADGSGGATRWNDTNNLGVGMDVSNETDHPDGYVTLTFSFSTSANNEYTNLADITRTVRYIDDEPTTVAIGGGGPSEEMASQVMREGDASTSESFTVTLGRPLVEGEKVRVPVRVRGLDNGASIPTVQGLRVGANLSYPAVYNDVTMTASGTGVSYIHVDSTPLEHVGIRVIDFEGEGAQTATVTMTPRDGFDDGETGHEVIEVSLYQNLGIGSLPEGTPAQPLKALAYIGAGTNVGGGIAPVSGTPTRYFGIEDDEGGAGVVPSNWPLLPSGLNPGDSFRLLYVTKAKTPATNPNLGYYDVFARSDIAGEEFCPAFWNLGPTGVISTQDDQHSCSVVTPGPDGTLGTGDDVYGDFDLVGGGISGGVPDLKPYAGSFKAIVSSFESFATQVHAVERADFGPGGTDEVIYWVDGTKVADNNSDFADSTWDDEANPRYADGTLTQYDMNGTATNGPDPDGYWTGSFSHGESHSTTGGEDTACSGGGFRVGIGNSDDSGNPYVVQVGYLNISGDNEKTPLGQVALHSGGGFTGARHAINCLGEDPAEERSVYALSGVFTVGAAQTSVPEVSIAKVAESVVEGTAAQFTVTADPAPVGSALPVNVTLLELTGSFGVDTTARVVSVPTSGSASFSVATTGDSADEAGGSLLATVSAASDSSYTVSSSAGSVSVPIADDDPTVVSLARTDSGNIAEGGAGAAADAEFTVTLGRVLLGTGKSIEVPLVLSGSNVTASDVMVAAKSGVTDHSFTVTGGNTLTPTVTFTGAGANTVRTATLVLTARADSTAGEAAETITVALGPNDATANGFDHSSRATNVGGGADPHATARTFNVGVDADTATGTAVTVAMAKSGGDADGNAVENAGDGTEYVTVTLTLGRALAGSETVTVPLAVQGATVATDYTFALHPSTQTGVSLVTSGGTHTAQDPAVQFASGASSATLRLTAVDNSDRTQPYVVIDYGDSPAPSAGGGATLGDVSGGPVGVVLMDDETIDIVVPSSWGLVPSGVGAGEDFRLLFRSSSARDATSTDIADYDAFVRQVVAVGGHSDIVRYAGFFKVLGGTRSTSGSTGTSARVHNEMVAAGTHTGHHSGATDTWADGSTRATVGSSAGTPTYWLGGAILANNYADMCDLNWSGGGGVTSGWDTDDPQTEAGTRAVPAGTITDYQPYEPWTGSGNACEAFDHPLGAATVSKGAADSGGGQALLHQSAQANTQERPLYGYSPVFKAAGTVVPELAFPSSTPPRIVEEDDGTVNISVSADNAPSGALTVNYSVTGSTATSGTDYAALSGSFTFPASQSSANLPITFIDDMVAEQNELMTLRLDAGDGYTVGTPSTFTMTILDNDSAPVSLSSESYTVLEGASDAAITVNADGVHDRRLDTVLMLADGTAVGASGGAGADYDSDYVAANIAAGQTSVSAAIAITDDNSAEPDETFTVTLTTTRDHVTIGSPSTATVTIADDDHPQGLLFSPPIADGISVPEAGTATYTVRPTTAPTGNVVVTVTGAQDGITVDADGSGGNSLTFTPTNWYIAQKVTVAAADDADSTDEMVTLTHAPVGGGYTAASHSASYPAEADDDEGGGVITVTMSAADGDSNGDIVENQSGATGYKTITISLDRALTATETVTVPLLVAGATEGTDYTFALNPSSQTGVTLDTSTNPYSAQDPAVVFSRVGAQTATLRLTQMDNSDPSQPAISISYGTVSADGANIAATEGSPIVFSIVDDETGDLVVPANWALKPADVGAGDEFRLIFITTETRTAESTDIDDYNDWVQELVARNGHPQLKPYGGLVNVVASTATTDARENLGMWSGSAYTDGSASASDSGVEIFWLRVPSTTDVADNYHDFFDGSWDGGLSGGANQSNEDSTEAAAERTTGDRFFTGTSNSGTAVSATPLGGSGQVTVGNANSSGNTPINDATTAANTDALAMMAMTPVFTVEAPVISVMLATVEGARTATGEVPYGEGEGGITPINFPVTATPAPTANLMVCVQVAESGHGGVDRVASSAEGVQTVAVTSSGSVEHMVAYANTAVDEPDSVVTVTVLAPEAAGCSLAAGSYTVSTTNPSDKARIVDDEATVAELASGDMVMVEGVPAGTAEVTVSLERRLYDGEVVEIELRLSTGTGAQLPHHGTPDFTVSSVSGSGVALSDAAVQATAPAGSTDPAPDHTAPKVTFTGDNSNTVQSATVTFAPTAGRDSDSDDETITVSLAPSITLRAATGSNVGGKATRHASDYEVDLTLAEAVAVSVSELRVAENGGTATYEVRLLTAPSGGNTTVTIAKANGTGVNPDMTAATLTDKDGNVVSTLTFTPSNFADAQVVTVTGMDELSVFAMATDSPTYRDRTLQLTHTANGGGYSSQSLGDIDVIVQEAPQIETYSGRISTAQTPGPYRNGLPARHTLGVALQTDVFSTMDFFVRASDRPVGGTPTVDGEPSEPITVTLTVASTYTQEDLTSVRPRSSDRGPLNTVNGSVIGMQLTRSSPVVQTLTLTFHDRPIGPDGCGILFNDDGEMGDGTPDSSFECPRIVYLVKTDTAFIHGCQDIDVAVSGGSVRTGGDYDPEPITVHFWNGNHQIINDKGGGYKSACAWDSVVPRWSDPRPEPRTEYCVLGGRFVPPTTRSCFHFVDNLPARSSQADTGWAPEGAHLVHEGSSARYEIDLGVTVQNGQSYELELKPAGATMGDDYTLALDTANSPHVSVDPNQPLDSAAPRLIFAPGARVASVIVTAVDDAVHEREVLTIGYGEYRYKTAGRPDKVTYPKTKALFAIIDSTPLVPTVPVANLTVTADDAATATATWDPVAGATAYNVSYQGNGADPLNNVSAAVHGHTATTWTFAHNAAEPDMTITVTVTPVRTAGDGTTTAYHALSSAADLDLAAAPECVPDLPADAVTVAEVTGWRDAHSGAAHVLRWNRVLEALGHDTGTGAAPLTADESRANEDLFMFSRWDRVTRTLQAIARCDDTETTATVVPPPPPDPEISIASGGDVTEGGNAVFTLTASPAPTAALDVTVAVAATGEFGATPGSHTVTVSTGGTGTLTVATAGDSADEPDGSITAAISTGAGYTVSAAAATATAAVADDDDPPPPPPVCTPNLPDDAVTVAEVTGWRDAHSHDAAHVQRWNRVLAALGEDTGAEPLTIAESQANENEFMRSRWDRVTRTLQAHTQCDDTGTGTSTDTGDGTSTDGTDDDSTDDGGTDDGGSDPPPPPPVEPEISITAGNGVTEGGSATFTLSASPPPSAALTVDVTVAQAGDFGATTGSRTVTISTSGAATLTVSTSDDSTDEPDGSVTVAVDTGGGYTVSATAATASVAITDDDDPPPPPPPPTEPEISITADGDVTEGGDATFTLTASPPPTAALTVHVSVTQQGSFGVTTGSRQVTISPSGTGSLTVSTSDDSADEPDGSVTAAVGPANGYTVSAAAGEAAVAVSDDDDPPPALTLLPPNQVSFSVDDVTAAEGETARIRVWLSDPAAKRVRIWWSTRYHYGGDHAAYPGRDHPQERGWLAFEPGDVEHHIEMPLTDDTAAEPDETFLIHLGFAEGGPQIADREAAVTITDND